MILFLFGNQDTWVFTLNFKIGKWLNVKLLMKPQVLTLSDKRLTNTRESWMGWGLVLLQF